jgi:4-hydroxythreonine-4-phosphate dehydrogenase
MGDAAGIGPEIVLKALSDQRIASVCVPVIIGDAKYLQQTAVHLDLGLSFQVVDSIDEVPLESSGVYILDAANINAPVLVGEDTALGGKAAGEYIETAARLCLEGKLAAMATAPISKKALAMGGYNFPGHTEMLAELTGTSEFAMSFFAGDLRVVLLSTHISLVDAIDFVTTDNMVGLIRFTDQEMSRLLRRKVSIAVAGLNPHASEFGMFGNEEAERIEPAIEKCKAEGINVSGPYSPDTIFLRAYRGEFDAVIACYHDQATIAVKCLSFGESVNVTLGLPIIRTSVDHGTAFNIAGKNTADCSSMKAAIELAAKLSLSS